jgi:RHS repeat-associated protein
LDGNVTSRTYSAAPCPNQNIAFTWAADSRLDSINIGGGAAVRFHYDAFGRLVRREINGSARSYFLWDGDYLLAELDGTGAGKVAEYSWYGLDNPHAMVREAFAHHAHTDALGNVIALTNQDRQVTRTNTYDEWGRLIAATDTELGDSARTRWKGALWMGPEVELYYMRNRWYEPWTGRFLSEDPIGLAGGMNQYLFAAADPIRGLDPFGLQYPVKPIEATASCNTPPRSTEGKCAPGGAGPVIFQDPDQCLHSAICVSGTIGSAGAGQGPRPSRREQELAMFIAPLQAPIGCGAGVIMTVAEGVLTYSFARASLEMAAGMARSLVGALQWALGRGGVAAEPLEQFARGWLGAHRELGPHAGQVAIVGAASGNVAVGDFVPGSGLAAVASWTADQCGL